MIAGFLVAVVAAAAYETAYVLQAVATRREESGERIQASLIVRLAQRPLWLLATALSGVGVVAQVIALTMAPLTVVQPTLALGLVGLLVLARTRLGEHVGVREWAAVAAIVVGVAVIALIGPEADDGDARGVGVAILLAVLGAVTVAPYVWRRAADPRLRVCSAAAGDAAAAIGMALIAAALGTHDWVAAAAWAIGAAAAGVLALNAEMSALQRLPASQVAPLVLAAQVVIPVASAPLLLGQPWGAGTLGNVAIALAVALVAGAAAVLGASRPLGDVLAMAHEPAGEEVEDDVGGGRPVAK